MTSRPFLSIPLVVLAALAFACGDGCSCSCGADESPTLAEPSDPASFEAAQVPSAPIEHADVANPAPTATSTPDAGDNETGEGSAEPEGPHRPTVNEQLRIGRPEAVQIRPIRIPQPQALPNRISPTVVDPQIRQVGANPSGPRSGVDPEQVVEPE